MAATNASIHCMEVEVEGDVDVMDDWNNCWNQFVLWCWVVVEDDDAIRNHSSALARKKFHASATILGGTTIILS